MVVKNKQSNKMKNPKSFFYLGKLLEHWVVNWVDRKIFIRTKEITLANHKLQRKFSESIKSKSKQTKTMQCTRKCV